MLFNSVKTSLLFVILLLILSKTFWSIFLKVLHEFQNLKVCANPSNFWFVLTNNLFSSFLLSFFVLVHSAHNVFTTPEGLTTTGLVEIFRLPFCYCVILEPRLSSPWLSRKVLMNVLSRLISRPIVFIVFCPSGVFLKFLSRTALRY